MEVETIFDLPPEMLAHIFKFCAKESLINIACCSKECYYMVIHFLCRYFEIRWSDIVSTPRIVQKLRNLKYANCLVFYNGNDPFYSGPTWDVVDRNYKRILNCCNGDELKTLYIVKSQMNDVALDMTLKLFRNVENIRLEDCTDVTSSSLSCLAHLSSVKKLYISSCNIDDDNVNNFRKLPSLDDLSIALCPLITGLSLEYVSQIGTLKRLKYCEYGILSANDFTKIGKLTNLTSLDIGGCLIAEDELANLINMLTSLRMLNLAGIGLTNAELSLICKIKSLTKLGLSGCGVTDDGIHILSVMKTLWSLDLSWHSGITDVGLAYISKMRKLTGLSLCFCNKITDDGIKLLKSLRFLRRLDISVCELLTDASLISLSSFLALKVIHINECISITNAGIDYIERNSVKNIRFEERDFDLEERENLSSTL